MRENVSRYHAVETDSPEFNRLETDYLTMLRRMHQNALWIPENDHFPVVTALGNNNYTFDFTEMEAYIRKAFALGFNRIYHRLGYRQSWEESTILVNGIPSTSYEGYCWLAQYLTALHRFLSENGWLCFEIGDTQGKAVADILTENGYKNAGIMKDYEGRDRVVTGFKF